MLALLEFEHAIEFPCRPVVLVSPFSQVLLKECCRTIPQGFCNDAVNERVELLDYSVCSYGLVATQKDGAEKFFKWIGGAEDLFFYGVCYYKSGTQQQTVSAGTTDDEKKKKKKKKERRKKKKKKNEETMECQRNRAGAAAVASAPAITPRAATAGEAWRWGLTYRYVSVYLCVS
jgi:hypothetical protein